MTICIHCRCPLERKDVTDDHIPPACLFPEKRKTKGIIEAPSCKACNEGSNLDDELFKLSALNIAATGNQSAKTVSESFLRSLDIPQKVKTRNKFFSLLTPIEMRSEGGLYLGDTFKFPLDVARMLRIAKKVTRGLYWHHKEKTAIPEGYEVQAQCLTYLHTKPEARRVLEGMEVWLLELDQKPIHSIGERVFQYKFSHDEKNDSVIFLMCFYEWIEFFTIVMSPKLLDETRKLIGRTASVTKSIATG